MLQLLTDASSSEIEEYLTANGYSPVFHSTVNELGLHTVRVEVSKEGVAKAFRRSCVVYKDARLVNNNGSSSAPCRLPPSLPQSALVINKFCSLAFCVFYDFLPLRIPESLVIRSHLVPIFLVRSDVPAVSSNFYTYVPASFSAVNR